MNKRITLILAVILFAAVSAYTAVVYPQLPAQIPTHWGISGQPDDWSDKGQACLFMLGMLAGIPLLIQGLSFLSPKGYEVDSWRGTLNTITLFVMGLIGYLHIAMLQTGLHPKVDFARYLIGGLMLFFALVGNLLGKVRKNFWVGVRTPWTLASDEVWIQTHRFTARLWAIVGTVCAVLALAGASLTFVFVVMMAAALYPVLHSLFIYRKIEPPSKPLTSALIAVLLFGLGSTGTASTTESLLPTQTSYDSKELSFKGADGFELKGTLFTPKLAGGKSAPAVLLLPGSGAPDRDGNSGTLLVSNVYKEMAVHLAENGYAVFRYDKRSVASSYASQYPKDVEGINEMMGWDKFVGDAVEAYRFLRKQPGIDAERVVVAGHSEGGMITVQLAHDLADAADAPKGIMILAGPGRRLDKALMEQLELQFSLRIPDEAMREKYLDYSRKAIAQIQKDGTLPSDPVPPGLNSLFNRTALKLLRAYFTIEPATLCGVYKGDVLVVNGELDAQISAERDAPVLVEAYKKRKAGTCELAIIPKASHFLKKVEKLTDNPNEGSVLPDALNAMTKWLKAKIGS